MQEETRQTRSPGYHRPDARRRRLLQGATALAGAALLPFGARANSSFPERQLNLVVPFVPGGPVDITGRALADPLGRQLHQNVIVVNKAGAGGNIGAEDVASSRPDGHTLLLALDSMLTVNPYFYGDGTRVPALEPIGQIGELSSVLVVNARSPIKSVADFLAHGRERPLTAGSGGNATAGHLYTEWLNRDFGVQLTHVPYKGLSPAVQDLLAGNIDCIVALIPGVLPHIQAGTLLPLGLTSERPQPLLPDVPALSSQGLKGFSGASWLTLMVPKGVPDPVKATLTEALSASLNEPATIERLQAVGIDPYFQPANAVEARIQGETRQWESLLAKLKQAGA